MTFTAGKDHRKLLGETYEACHHRLLYLALRKVGDPSAAEDLLHRAFVVALRAMEEGKIRDEEKIIPFLVGTINNLALKHHRNGKTFRTAALSLTTQESRENNPGPETATAARQDLAVVARTVRKMKRIDRRLMRFYFIDRLPPGEVARRLGISGNNLKVRLHRLRQQLREALSLAHAPADPVPSVTADRFLEHLDGVSQRTDGDPYG